MVDLRVYKKSLHAAKRTAAKAPVVNSYWKVVAALPEVELAAAAELAAVAEPAAIELAAAPEVAAAVVMELALVAASASAVALREPSRLSALWTLLCLD